MQERFYEVSDSFKKALTTESGSEGSQTFSLLQAFGAKSSDEEDKDGNNEGTEEDKLPLDVRFLRRPDKDFVVKREIQSFPEKDLVLSLLEYVWDNIVTKEENAEETEEDKLPLDVRFLRRPDKDFVDGDDEDMEVDDLDKSRTDNDSSGGPLKGKEDTRTFFFFFKDQDERMQESATKFHRTEDLEVIREQWKKEKQGHIQRFKMKAKNFSRKKIQPGHEKHGDIFERRKIDRRLKNLHSKKK